MGRAVPEQERAAWLRAVIDTAVDGIVIIDAQGLVRSFNRACERLFGHTAAEVVGHNVKMLMPSPYHEQHDGYLGHYRTTGEKRIIGSGRHVSGRRADGTVFPMYLSVGEIPAIGGADRQFLGIIHDTSEQHAVEEELRESAERLRSILNLVPDAIIVIDEHGLIETFSAAAERLFGWSADEVRGRNVSMLMPAPYRNRHDGYLTHYLDTGERRIIGIGRVVVGLRQDGSTFPMELAVGEMQLSGRRRFTGFVRDLTEHELAEKRLQTLQTELLHVSRLSAMGEMAAALAHELNQPLTAVINWTQAARRLLDQPDVVVSEKTRDFMDKAIGQANRAGQIIRRLRDFVSKGDTDHRLEDINKVVEEASALALVGAQEHSVHAVLQLEPNLPEVLIDKVQIQQVVINLVRNAVEAVAAVESRRVTISTGIGAGKDVQVTVADTGPGLSADVAARLFQPFVTTKQRGMGIGLSISRTIIDNHGGRLVASENPGGGVIFSFNLPLPDDEATSEGPEVE